MNEKPKTTKLAFERPYSDGSGVEFAVRYDASESDLNGGKGTVEFHRIHDASFPLSELDWLIRCLTVIREHVGTPQPEDTKGQRGKI